MVPNSVVLSVAVTPLREPAGVDLRARLPLDVRPDDVQELLEDAITVRRPRRAADRARGDRRRRGRGPRRGHAAATPTRARCWPPRCLPRCAATRAPTDAEAAVSAPAPPPRDNAEAPTAAAAPRPRDRVRRVPDRRSDAPLADRLAARTLALVDIPSAVARRGDVGRARHRRACARRRRGPRRGRRLCRRRPAGHRARRAAPAARRASRHRPDPGQRPRAPRRRRRSTARAPAT